MTIQPDGPDRAVTWRELRGLLVVLAGVLLLIALGAGWAVEASRDVVHKGDLTPLQARQIRDAATLSHDNCNRAQHGRRALAIVVHTAVPPHSPTYSKDEQAKVNTFYAKLNKLHALQIPKCPDPATPSDGP